MHLTYLASNWVRWRGTPQNTNATHTKLMEESGSVDGIYRAALPSQITGKPFLTAKHQAIYRARQQARKRNWETRQWPTAPSESTTPQCCHRAPAPMDTMRGIEALEDNIPVVRGAMVSAEPDITGPGI